MSTIPARTLKTKSGKDLLVRSGEPRDAAALVEFMGEIFRDGEGMTRMPEEFTMTVEQEAAWLEEMTQHSDCLVLVAEIDGQLAGMIDFKPGQRRVQSHTGMFGVSVRPRWRSDGVGKPLLEALLEWARTHPRIEKVNLAVLADNTRAIALYEKLGFVREGYLLRASKFDDGRYVDDVLMGQFVKPRILEFASEVV